MFAVVETGGKQYKVAPGDQLDVELLGIEAGQQFDLGRVLMVGSDGGEVLVGSPLVDGARVVATVVAEHRGDKLIVFKYKAKKRYRRKNGHRQMLTRVSIDDILADGIADKAQPEAKVAPTKAKKVAAAPIEVETEQPIIAASTAPAEVETEQPIAEASAAPSSEVETEQPVAAASSAPAAEVETEQPIAAVAPAPVETAAAATGEADLEWVDGIGPAFNRVLGEHGIHSTEDLAATTVEQLHATGITRDEEEFTSWIQQAKDKLAGK